jgi:uncharacterized protein involved in exopolysaccharide biosynthesis
MGVVAGIVVGSVSTPVYRVETLLTPVSSTHGAGILSGISGSIAGLAGLAGVDLGGSTTQESAFATLTSRSLVREFIISRGLQPILFSERDSAPGLVGRLLGAEKERTLEDSVDLFLESILQVTRDRRTGLVRVAIEWKDPAVSADWANGLVQLANERLRQSAVADSRRAVEYLSNELERNASIEVQQSIYRIIEAQMNAAAAANASPEFAFKIVDPAVAPDRENYVRPKKAVLAVLLGLLFLLGAAAVILWSARRQLWA